MTHPAKQIGLHPYTVDTAVPVSIPLNAHGSFSHNDMGVTMSVKTTVSVNGCFLRRVRVGAHIPFLPLSIAGHKYKRMIEDVAPPAIRAHMAGEPISGLRFTVGGRPFTIPVAVQGLDSVIALDDYPADVVLYQMTNRNYGDFAHTFAALLLCQRCSGLYSLSARFDHGYDPPWLGAPEIVPQVQRWSDGIAVRSGFSQYMDAPPCRHSEHDIEIDFVGELLAEAWVPGKAILYPPIRVEGTTPSTGWNGITTISTPPSEFGVEVHES